MRRQLSLTFFALKPNPVLFVRTRPYVLFFSTPRFFLSARCEISCPQIEGLRRAAQHIINLHTSLQQSTQRVDAGGNDSGEVKNANDKPCRKIASVARGDDARTGWSRGGEGEEGERGGEGEDTAMHIKDAIAARDGFPFCQNADAGGSREKDDLPATFSSSAGPSEDIGQGAGDDNDNGDDKRSLGATYAAASSSDERRRRSPLAMRQEQAGGEGEESAAVAGAGATREADKACENQVCCEQPPGEVGWSSGSEERFSRPPLSGSRSWRASSRAMDISPPARVSRTSSWDSFDSVLSTGSGNEIDDVRGRDEQQAQAGAGASGDSDHVANGGGRTGGGEADVEETGGGAASAQSEESMSADDFLPLFSLVLVSFHVCCWRGLRGLYAL